MSKNKRIAPNVIRGGVAIPLGSNYFLMKGRTHREGGIDVGKDLEVEDGELMKVTKNNIKVLSDQPIFNGISPAEYAIDGNVRKRFEKAFNAQERFKKVNGLNDDGTKKAKYGTNKKIIGEEENKIPKFKLGELQTDYLYYEDPFGQHALHHTTPNPPYRPLEEYYAFTYINNDIENGALYLYDKYMKDNTFYKDKEGNYYRYPYKEEGGIPNPDIYTEVPYSKIRQMLPKRDYIGGNKREVGIKVIDKVPGLKDEILRLSKVYGISPNVFTNRLINEGWVQGIADEYNTIYSKHQKEYDWSDIMNRSVSGYGQLGLDTFGNYDKEGKLNLRRPIQYEDSFNTNEDKTGREYNSAYFENAYDALEAKAAMLEYFTKVAKKRNISENDLDAYVNAMYNMGEYHKDLNNIDYVRKEYGFKPYFKLGGKMNIKNNSSTGKKTKAEMGTMKIDKHGNLIGDIQPSVITGEKRNIIKEIIINELLKDSLKLKRDKTVKTNRIKAEFGTEAEPSESIVEIAKRIVEDSQASSNRLAAKITKFNPPLGDNGMVGNKIEKIDSSKIETQIKRNYPKAKQLAEVQNPTKFRIKHDKRWNDNEYGTISRNLMVERMEENKASATKFAKQVEKEDRKEERREYRSERKEARLKRRAERKDARLERRAERRENRNENDEGKISFFEANPTFVPNLIGAGINVAGSLISHRINKKFLDSIEEPKAPYLLQPTKLKTRININPQVDELRRTVNRYNKYFDKNTASSQTAVGRRLNNEQVFIDGFNQIKGNQENQETSLINQDRAQQHETAKFNLTNYNQWLRDKTNFKNSLLEKKAENNTALVQNIASSATNFIDKENQWKRDMMTLAAIAAGNPNVSGDQMAEAGLPYAKYMEQRRQKREERRERRRNKRFGREEE